MTSNTTLYWVEKLVYLLNVTSTTCFGHKVRPSSGYTPYTCSIRHTTGMKNLKKEVELVLECTVCSHTDLAIHWAFCTKIGLTQWHGLTKCHKLISMLPVQVVVIMFIDTVSRIMKVDILDLMDNRYSTPIQMFCDMWDFHFAFH
jgi:hypothetical protein